jgi:hypothetical protein
MPIVGDAGSTSRQRSSAVAPDAYVPILSYEREAAVKANSCEGWTSGVEMLGASSAVYPAREGRRQQAVAARVDEERHYRRHCTSCISISSSRIWSLRTAARSRRARRSREIEMHR